MPVLTISAVIAQILAVVVREFHQAIREGILDLEQLR